jgi:DDE superfamily endonuclease
LFDLGDALLSAEAAPSLPWLSLQPAFRRGWGMVYQGLAEGRVDAEALRDTLVAHRPADWPCVFAVDASTIPLPQAETSPGRQFHHIPKGGRVGGEPVIAGWAWQWLSQLNFDADAWTAPQDMVRVGPGDDPRRQAVDQIIAHSGRLAAAGESRVPLYVLDAGYDEAALTYDLREHLDRVQVLVRIRDDRVLYRDPPPRQPGQPGRPRRHAKQRFECKNPATWASRTPS